MDKTIIYYSVRNGGDGSAYPIFMESLELAKYDQEFMEEEWGESCTGNLVITHNSPITIETKIKTKESYYLDLLEYNPKQINHFLEKFFPNGFPIAKVRVALTDNPEYLNNHITIDGKEVAVLFKNVKDSGRMLEDKINDFIPW